LNIAHPARTGGFCGLTRLGSGGLALQVAADVAGRMEPGNNEVHWWGAGAGP